jgi:hypothetical protein
MVVSSEDQGKSDNRWVEYKEYEMHGRNQVSWEGNRSRWKESGFSGMNQVSLVVLRIWRDDGMIRIMGRGLRT